MLKKHVLIACMLTGLSACQTIPVQDTPDIAIEGTWLIEAVQGEAVIDYSPAQLVFADGGKLSGNNSCNEFFGQYKLDGQQLELSPAGSTMKACVDALMNQEQRVMQAMASVTQANESKGKLLLKDVDGNIQLSLTKTDTK
ncbi:META domain-containing protein [Shewanella psychrotolerans]|uniref:META domain-containing protein n=1 Tax=Shewanella psychrotolerans TaxID=2864206 RepID=UPI001C65AB24|nr:META domain-containing protein [Shewanella psychrotolerans]QYK00823.1 META domain-containing protein [Shewanella psychrotolerans]